MTKCNVIGNTEVTGKKKSIEFCNYLSGGINAGFEKGYEAPSDWDNIILLYKRVDYDYMYAWNNGEEQDGSIYQGYWNDGVAE
jgi:hypothetical protein